MCICCIFLLYLYNSAKTHLKWEEKYVVFFVCATYIHMKSRNYTFKKAEYVL